jgi:pyruvate kinase
MVDIYGTLGPSCDDEEILFDMFKEGMTGIRINLSHVKLADCVGGINRIKDAADRCGIIPKLLIDMQGPELRIGALSEQILINEDDTIFLCACDSKNTKALHRICVDKIILENLTCGHKILLDDGKILAEVIEVDDNKHCAKLKVKRGGILGGKKSIAIEGVTIDMPALTDDDKENLSIAAKNGITGVMQPFVRSENDLKELRNVLDEHEGQNIKIYAKIENMAGVDNLDSFFPYSDEIIIARGDLGNAMPLWELPGVQKNISKICKENEMPFMVVTQMLSSMEHSKVPTRAEVSDIFNAVLDGASSVMVTGETAVGDNPVEVIKYLKKTVEAALRYTLNIR